MEPAETDVHSSRDACGSRRHLQTSLRPSLRIALLLALISFIASSVWAEGYLARFGPPPLRFASPPAKTNIFVWPTLLVQTNSATNGVDLASLGTIDSATNAVSLKADSPTSLASEPLGPPGPPVGLPSPLGPVPLALANESNSLSASNLLSITPQMLADYFRACLETSYRSSTNTGDVLFNPPLPMARPASSEAIYRVQ